MSVLIEENYYYELNLQNNKNKWKIILILLRISIYTHDFIYIRMI